MPESWSEEDLTRAHYAGGRPMSSLGPEFEKTTVKPVSLGGAGALTPAHGEASVLAFAQTEVQPTEQRSVSIPGVGAVAVARDEHLVLMSSTGTPGEVQVTYDDSDLGVLVCVDHGIYLDDGDLICAGRCWFRYTEGVGVHSPQLQVLGSDGTPLTNVLVRDGSLSVGRDVGDLILPREDLAAVHLRVERDERSAVLFNLAGPSRTWLLVRSGNIIPDDCVLSIGDQTVTLRPSRAACSETRSFHA